jgi:hypothetical protein
MQHYDDNSLTEIKKAYSELRFKYIDLTRDIFSFAYNIKNERAKEYFQHGVLRRLWLLYKCIDNIFYIFPPDKIERLSQDDRLNVEINLHAFLINIYGIIDNAALALAYENDLVGDKSKGKFDPKKINLFEKKFQKKLIHNYAFISTIRLPNNGIKSMLRIIEMHWHIGYRPTFLQQH